MQRRRAWQPSDATDGRQVRATKKEKATGGTDSPSRQYKPHFQHHALLRLQNTRQPPEGRT